jgi:gamma-glutamyltranspeptidase/glutathione hydrolase
MRHIRIGTLLAMVIAAWAAVPTGVAAAAPGHDLYPNEPVATGTGGAVASMDVNASRAGIDVLRRGGNAVDAAVATASALGVSVPFVAGPGGGGFMVIYNARTHQVTTIDGRESCPSACTATMFINPATEIGRAHV